MEIDFSQRLIVLDTEFTTDFKDGRACLCEVGAVELIDGVVGRTYHRFLNPKAYIPEQATRIHGLTQDFLADQPTFDQEATDFLAFIGGDPIVAHDAKHDLRAINHDLTVYGRPVLSNRMVCTLALYRHVFGEHLGLDRALVRCGMEPRQGRPHRAITDALLLADTLRVVKDIPRAQWTGWTPPPKKVRVSPITITVEDGIATFVIAEVGTRTTPLPPFPEGYRASVGHQHILILPPDSKRPENPLGPCVIGVKDGEILMLTLQNGVKGVWAASK